MTIAPPPLLNPTLSDLLERIGRHLEGRRSPTSMAMSPETWDRLKAEAAAAPQDLKIIDNGDRDRSLNGIRVALYEGCLGVGIAYEQR